MTTYIVSGVGESTPSESVDLDRAPWLALGISNHDTVRGGHLFESTQ